jgi:hypothetical protein
MPIESEPKTESDFCEARLDPEMLMGHAPLNGRATTPLRSEIFQSDRQHAVPLRDLAFAAIARLITDENLAGSPEGRFLTLQRENIGKAGQTWNDVLESSLRAPCAADLRLIRLSIYLKLSTFEILALALAAAVEDDPFASRVLARIQSPIATSRPTIGLLLTAFAPVLYADQPGPAAFLNGAAFNTELLVCVNESAPLPERAVALPIHLYLALHGCDATVQGVEIGLRNCDEIVLAPSTLTEAARQARVLSVPNAPPLLLRCGSPSEARATADAIARAMQLRPAFIHTESVAGLGPWFVLRRLMPVFICDLGPSERRVLPPIPGYTGPLLIQAGPEGGVETSRGSPASWTLQVPPPAERGVLWRASLGAENSLLADQLAAHYRHGSGRIAQVGRLARRHAALRQQTGPETHPANQEDIMAASWVDDAGGLQSLAQPLRAQVPDEALVTPPVLRVQLELLLLRCRSRDGLVDGLGPAAVARYRPGVRALLSGPSGTGKTLAAGWLATRLGLPLYRVDLASVTSKYIGETEKNLAKVLAYAEQDEVVLLFDEADSLFGKRTDIKDSNDRFANAQTNYLLQRIEIYDGIVLLTSNSRVRFDSAFARRLDCVLEFHLPSPEQRRELWLAHLGKNHQLAPAELNQLAALADVAGGHIRNAVLTASLLAHDAGCAIRHTECVRGLELEYQKLGKPLPGDLDALLKKAQVNNRTVPAPSA